MPPEQPRAPESIEREKLANALLHYARMTTGAMKLMVDFHETSTDHALRNRLTLAAQALRDATDELDRCIDALRGVD